MGFYNDEQGNVTCFSQFDLTVTMDIPTSSVGQTVELTGLSVDTNFAGRVVLDSQIVGQVLAPGNIVAVTLQGQIDLSSRRTYSLLYKLEGVSDPSGTLCTGSGVLTFDAGHPSPAGLPTSTPTFVPSISPTPTVNRADAACSVRAQVVCEVIREGQVQALCDTIQDPAMAICSDGERPSMLSFTYSATDETPQPAIITVEGEDDTQTFQIEDGQTFSAEMRFGDEAAIRIQDFDDYEIDTICESRTDVFLFNTFGPLTLVSFENGLGRFSSTYEIRNIYFILMGPLDGMLESAVIDSGLQSQSFAATSQGLNLRRNSRTIVHQETTVIDVTDKFTQGVSLEFSMDVTMRTSFNGMSCMATDTYTL